MWNLLQIILLVPRILRWFQEFRKIWGPPWLGTEVAHYPYVQHATSWWNMLSQSSAPCTRQKVPSKCWHLSSTLTQHHTPEHHDLNTHSCKNLRSHLIYNALTSHHQTFYLNSQQPWKVIPIMQKKHEKSDKLSPVTCQYWSRKFEMQVSCTFTYTQKAKMLQLAKMGQNFLLAVLSEDGHDTNDNYWWT